MNRTFATTLLLALTMLPGPSAAEFEIYSLRYDTFDPALENVASQLQRDGLGPLEKSAAQSWTLGVDTPMMRELDFLWLGLSARRFAAKSQRGEFEVSVHSLSPRIGFVNDVFRAVPYLLVEGNANLVHRRREGGDDTRWGFGTTVLLGMHFRLVDGVSLAMERAWEFAGQPQFDGVPYDLSDHRFRFGLSFANH